MTVCEHKGLSIEGVRRQVAYFTQSQTQKPAANNEQAPVPRDRVRRLVQFYSQNGQQLAAFLNQLTELDSAGLCSLSKDLDDKRAQKEAQVKEELPVKTQSVAQSAARHEDQIQRTIQAVSSVPRIRESINSVSIRRLKNQELMVELNVNCEENDGSMNEDVAQIVASSESAPVSGDQSEQFSIQPEAEESDGLESYEVHVEEESTSASELVAFLNQLIEYGSSILHDDEEEAYYNKSVVEADESQEVEVDEEDEDGEVEYQIELPEEYQERGTKMISMSRFVAMGRRVRMTRGGEWLYVDDESEELESEVEEEILKLEPGIVEPQATEELEPEVPEPQVVEEPKKPEPIAV